MHCYGRHDVQLANPFQAKIHSPVREPSKFREIRSEFYQLYLHSVFHRSKLEKHSFDMNPSKMERDEPENLRHFGEEVQVN